MFKYVASCRKRMEYYTIPNLKMRNELLNTFRLILYCVVVCYINIFIIGMDITSDLYIYLYEKVFCIYIFHML
jgi:hypothetical protein